MLQRQSKLKRLAPLLFSSSVYGLIGMMMNTVLVVYMERAGSSRFLEGFLFSASALAILVFPPVWGAVSDILGRPRAVMMSALAVAVLFIPLFMIFTDPVEVVIMRFFFVMFASGFMAPALAQVSTIGGRRRRGTALGILNSCMGLGRGAGRIGAGFLLARVAREMSFLIMMGLGATAIISLLLFEPMVPLNRTRTEKTFTGEVLRRLLPRVGDRDHLRRYGLIWLLVGFSLRDVAILGTIALMPVFLLKDAGFSEMKMGIFMSVNPLSQVVFQLFFGRLADRVGRKKLIGFGLLGSAAAPIMFSFASRPSLIFAGMVLIAFVYSSLAGGTTAFIGDAAPEGREGELMGLHVTFRGLGGFLGPIIVGTLASENLLGFKYAFISMSGLVFISFVMVMILTEETLPSKHL